MMVETEKNKLYNRKSKYLSIGITEDGIPRRTVGIPWVATVHAFNMRTPDVYLSPEDLQNEEIMALIESYKVDGCYIWAPLDDYSFLVRFMNLQDLNIKNGDAIRNLDFLTGLCRCRMLCLQNAKLKNLDMIVEMKKSGNAMFGCFECLGLDNCEVEDLSVFENQKVRFSEFLVWKPAGSDERDRWDVVSAGTHRYYEFKEIK